MCAASMPAGVRTAQLALALSDAGVTASDIDLCVVTSTQNIEMLVGLCDGLDICYGATPGHPVGSLYADHCPPDQLRNFLAFGLRSYLDLPDGHAMRQAFEAHFPEADDYRAGRIKAVGFPSAWPTPDTWNRPAGLSNKPEQFKDVGANEEFRALFHYPVTVTLNGREIPGYVVDHHMAHAASVYYRSGFRQAGGITHDGFASGASHQSGFFFVGQGEKLIPLLPHNLVIGALYDATAEALGLGETGGAGKLMGLAPYGEPRFFRRELVGNWHDYQNRLGRPLPEVWLPYCRSRAKDMGYDLTPLGDRARITEKINADIAASTQKIFEETCLDASVALYDIMRSFGVHTRNLCLSGGCMLNCPSNTRLLHESPFDNIFIEPTCGDDGLAIGAALHVYHNLLGNPVETAVVEANQSPYLGSAVTDDEIEAAIASLGDGIAARKLDDPARRAAELLADDKVLGWVEGRGEAGPRALGHRSILANATNAANWARVNDIKSRERWRPFAPVVLEEAASQWFRGAPDKARYMLFNAQLLSERTPAITHVDQSSRVQTVSAETGRLYDVLRHLDELTGRARGAEHVLQRAR